MSWASTTAAYTALRSRIGLDSTRFPDADAAACLAMALDDLSKHYPQITSVSYTNQTAKRITVGTTASFRQILAVEVPVDGDPREYKEWEHEEEGVVRLPDYTPGTETVRIWATASWTITTLPANLNEDCLTAAVAVGLSNRQAMSMVYWSQGQDANWGHAMQRQCIQARRDWEERRNELKAEGANRLSAFCENVGFFP